MEVKQNVNLHNRFDIEVRNIETDEIKKYTAFNIVLNQMWERLCAGNNYFSYIHFGTGTGTPIASRTSLFAHLGTKLAVDEELIKAIPISKWKRKIVLNPEEYVGSTITEVGVSFGSGTTNLVTHAMLKDAEGNQISITKSNTDVVTIYATVFITFGSQYENLKYIGLPSNNSLINYLVGGGSAPSGSFGLNEIINPYQRLGSTATAIWTSDIPNKKRKTNVNRFGITDGNGNAQVLDFTNLFALKLPQAGIFSGQPYTGVSVGVGDGIKKEFLLPSANVKQSSIFIKEDGVPNNAISITKKYKNAVRMPNPSNLPASAGRGVALTPDGNIMAVAHDSYPFITTYDWVDSSWVKRPNPSNLPANAGRGVALTPDGNIMAVAHDSYPFITTYDWVDSSWVKRPNPSNLPANAGMGVALTPDGNIMAVAHDSYPFITTYDWVDSSWVKRPNPSNLPANAGMGVALTPDGNIMAVAHDSSPFITTYDWVDSSWVKRPNPSNLPASAGRGVALTPDGNIMAVAYYSYPFITTYDWVDSSWVKRPNPSNLPASAGMGVALTPDGNIMAVAHDSYPFITTYDWVDSSWVKRPNPSNLPASAGRGVALTPDGNIMAVAYYSYPFITTYAHLPMTNIIFDTPPASGKVITADYTVDGIHKTDQYVVDVSFAIQFGEGV